MQQYESQPNPLSRSTWKMLAATARQVKLMDALKEVSMQEPETPWMFEDYRYILDNAERIKQVGQ